MKKRKNVVCMLFQREQFVVCPIRHNLKIVRLLVCQKDAHFSEIWQSSSNKHISYESGRLYMSNFRTCMRLKYSDKPRVCYELPSCTAVEKIEDCLIAQSAPASLLGVGNRWRKSFLALTAHNWLVRYDWENGKELQRVYLSNRFHFRHIEWNSDEHSFVLKSSHCNQRNIRNYIGNTADSNAPVLAVALFDVWPLQFTGLLEVNKKVFGGDLTNALVNQGCLVILHAGGLVRLYSLEHILAQGLLFEAPLSSSLSDGHIVGSPPVGLPVNIRLSERPAALFEIRCCDHDMTLGGMPWRYIMSPYKARGEFKIRSLHDHTEITGGRFECYPSRNVDPDICVFHEDDSGRILHVAAEHVRVLRVVEKSFNHGASVEYQLQEDYVINKQLNEKQSNDVVYSRSGRLVKRLAAKSYAEFDVIREPIHSVTYEDDLDLLTVTSIDSVAGDGDLAQCTVSLYDNQTGELMKVVPLSGMWDADTPFEHTLTLDLDTLLHIVKSASQKYTIHVYRLNRELNEQSSTDTQLPQLQRKRNMISQSRRRRR